MKKNQPNMYISWKTAFFWKIFWQFLWNCKVIFNSSPFLKRIFFSHTVKHVFLYFECRITYFHAKIFWQPYADLIAWFEMESVFTWLWFIAEREKDSTISILRRQFKSEPCLRKELALGGRKLSNSRELFRQGRIHLIFFKLWGSSVSTLNYIW